MQILNTAASLPSTPLDKLALYSAMDVLSLYEIKSGLMSLMDPGRLATYEFEMELQSALLDLSFNGIPVDEGARRELIVEFSKEQEELTTLLNRLLEEIGYFDYYRAMAVAEFSASLKPSVMNTVVDLSTTPLSSLVPSTWDEWKALPLSVRRVFKNNSPTALTTFQKALKSLDEPFNPNSPAQKLQLFYHFFGSPANTIAQEFFFAPPWLKTYGIPEYKSRNTKNEYTPAADRAALEKIVKASDSGPAYAAFWAAPFAHICITLADLAKSLGFLKCNLEHGLFKASFGAVTDTGRLSSRQNAQGYGSNAQNVTPKLRHIFVAPPKEIFCAGDYSQIESRVVAAICYQLFGLKNYIAATESGDLHSLAASMVWPELPWPEDFTLDWTLKHGPFPKDMLKAAKAIASVEFYRGKSRRDVSKTLGHGCLTSDHEVLTPSGWVSIATKPDVIMQIDGTFAKVNCWVDKEYDGQFVAWDGSSISLRMTANHRVYYTTKGDGLSVKPAIKVPKSVRIPLSREYQGGSVNEIYARLLAAYHCDGHWQGYKQTEFHFHKERKVLRLHKLAHEAGVEVVPRADNTKVILKWIPSIHAPCWEMLEWNKESLAAYMDELEYWDGSRNGAHLTIYSSKREWLEIWQTFYRLLGKGGNIHGPVLSGFGTEMYRLQVNNRKYASRESFDLDCTLKAATKVYCPSVPKEAFYVRRDGKICITGNTSYMGRPPQMSKHSHIDVKLIEHYQDVFFAMLPEIQMWHRWVVEQVQTKGEITTFLGRTRRFFGRPNDDATIRKAVAYEPQSVAADYCNRALLRLHRLALTRAFPATIRLSKHDELVVTCKESLEKEVTAIMVAQMEEHITLTSPTGETRDWFVPVEIESGWNMGRKSDSNPNGLSHPLDGRTRIELPSWKVWKM